jgi:hypothetical protein
VFPGADGYALGSIEGRVAIQYVLFISPPLLSFVRRTHFLRFVGRTLILGTSTIKTKSKHTSTIVLLVSSNRHGCRKNYSFRCHRKDQTPSGKDQTLVFSVNDIKFHPVHGTFATCGT